jgi:phenol 2-monooxygenase (NADPH)
VVRRVWCWLRRWPTSPTSGTAVIDRKDGLLEVGQADGVACRTVEMFEAFGLANRLIDEAYCVSSS